MDIEGNTGTFSLTLGLTAAVRVRWLSSCGLISARRPITRSDTRKICGHDGKQFRLNRSRNIASSYTCSSTKGCLLIVVYYCTNTETFH